MQVFRSVVERPKAALQVYFLRGLLAWGLEGGSHARSGAVIGYGQGPLLDAPWTHQALQQGAQQSGWPSTAREEERSKNADFLIQF